MSEELSNPQFISASNYIGRQFSSFAAKSTEDDFFHPCNRDLWLRSFAEFLKAKIDPDFPSND